MDRNQLIFFEEARDLLTELEETTLAIEHDPENMDLIGRIFRAIHTLKGSSSMFGCDVIAHFAHDVENADVREGIECALVGRDVYHDLSFTGGYTFARGGFANDLQIESEKIPPCGEVHKISNAEGAFYEKPETYHRYYERNRCDVVLVEKNLPAIDEYGVIKSRQGKFRLDFRLDFLGCLA